MTINFPELYSAQLEVAKACLDDTTKYITLNGSRQVGKTFILYVVSLYWALQEEGQTIMIVSPTDSMVKKIYKDIISLIGDGMKQIVKGYRAQSGDSEIVFKNGSTILFRSAASEDSLRGYSLTHLLLDEAAFIKEETYTTILAPTLTVKGKKVLFCSTPRGGNFFKTLYHRGLSGEKGYKSFKITWRDNPYADIDFIAEQRQVLPDEIYAQEYEGAFTDSTNVFKYVKELTHLMPSSPGEECVIGIDIAFKVDYTVAVALSANGDMLDYIRFNGVDTQELVQRLYNFIQKWSPRKTIIEENNQGLPVYHLLRGLSIYNLETFVTTSKSKAELINPLIAAFSKKEIGLIDDGIVDKEFEAFTYSLTKAGNVTFGAAYGHDDIVMATAFAFKAKGDSSISNVVWM